MKTAPKRARRGFTLIEILVVIGIILILLGMVVLGFRHIDAVASKRDTIAELHVCRDLLTEYEKLNGNANIVSVVYPPTGAVPRSVLLTDVQVGGVSDMSDRSNNMGARYNSKAVNNTRLVMVDFLMRVPRNRTMVSSLPTKRILESPPNTTPYRIEQTIVLDGWGNPIIFVPPAGLVVNIHDQSTNKDNSYCVRTTGTFPFKDQNSYNTQHPLSRADRPFFAAAGQDGDFTKGEDNIYSFQD